MSEHERGTLRVLDGAGDLLGVIGSLAELDTIPAWEAGLTRTVRKVAEANDGYIEDEDGKTVWDG